MAEPSQLAGAREHLAKAEAMILSEDGLFHLQEGLGLLEALIDSGADAQSVLVARNLGRTYTAKIHESIRQLIEKERNLPEPELEHLFAVIRAFDDRDFDSPPESRDLKVGVVKRLIDAYCEGHAPAEKNKAYEQLARVLENGGG